MSLTPQERQILSRMAEALDTKGTAERSGPTVGTVCTDVRT